MLHLYSARSEASSAGFPALGYIVHLGQKQNGGATRRLVSPSMSDVVDLRATCYSLTQVLVDHNMILVAYSEIVPRSVEGAMT